MTFPTDIVERETFGEDDAILVELGPWFRARATRAMPRQRGTGVRRNRRQVFADDYVTPRFREGKIVELRFRRWTEDRPWGKGTRRHVAEAFEVRGGGAYAGDVITLDQAATHFEVADPA